ncbi:6583_t:CDS:2, partial [Racocetra persica]
LEQSALFPQFLELNLDFTCPTKPNSTTLEIEPSTSSLKLVLKYSLQYDSKPAKDLEEVKEEAEKVASEKQHKKEIAAEKQIAREAKKTQKEENQKQKKLRWN